MSNHSGRGGEGEGDADWQRLRRAADRLRRRLGLTLERSALYRPPHAAWVRWVEYGREEFGRRQEENV